MNWGFKFVEMIRLGSKVRPKGVVVKARHVGICYKWIFATRNERPDQLLQEHSSINQIQ